MPRELLVGVIHGGEAAWRVFGPTKLKLKLVNVALPAASVFWVKVPLSTPLPLFKASVMGAPLVGNGVPLRDSAWTTTGASTAVAVAVETDGAVVVVTLERQGPLAALRLGWHG